MRSVCGACSMEVMILAMAKERAACTALLGGLVVFAVHSVLIFHSGMTDMHATTARVHVVTQWRSADVYDDRRTLPWVQQHFRQQHEDDVELYQPEETELRSEHPQERLELQASESTSSLELHQRRPDQELKFRQRSKHDELESRPQPGHQELEGLNLPEEQQQSERLELQNHHKVEFRQRSEGSVAELQQPEVELEFRRRSKHEALEFRQRKHEELELRHRLDQPEELGLPGRQQSGRLELRQKPQELEFQQRSEHVLKLETKERQNQPESQELELCQRPDELQQQQQLPPEELEFRQRMDGHLEFQQLEVRQKLPTPERQKSLQGSLELEQPWPLNSSSDDRIAWLTERFKSLVLPDILDGRHELILTSSTQSFRQRMSRFLAPCKLRFFMTWIAPLSSFQSREILALESLFKSHPTACLAILSSSLDSSQGRLLLQPFSSRGFLVSAFSPDLAFLAQSTPALPWFLSLQHGNIDPGLIPFRQNLSNLLRLLVLYKYGGIYLDSDIIVLRNFSRFSNAIGAQSLDAPTGKWNRLNNAVMIFDKKHPLLYKFIQEFVVTFNGSKWGHNGPYLVSRVVSREAGKRSKLNCKILPPSAFYPVNWEHIDSFFRAPGDSDQEKWVSSKLQQLKHSFSIHLWNKNTKDLKIEPGSIMDVIFRKNCVFCEEQRHMRALTAT